MYLLAFICPPLAVLICGKPIQACVNLVLCFTVVGAWIHAFAVVAEYKADKRTEKLADAMRR